MEHDTDGSTERPEDHSSDPSGDQSPPGCGLLILKIIGFGVVALVVMVALVFGVCLFGSG